MTNSDLSLDVMKQDHLIVRHPDGSVVKFPLPEEAGAVMRIGRELENEVSLVDPRVSRFHAEIRRVDADTLEIRDLESANGILLDDAKLKPNQWTRLESDLLVLLGDTSLTWQKAVSSQSTVAMRPVQKPPVVARRKKQPDYVPWAIGAVALLAAIIVVWFIFSALHSGPTTPDTPVTEGNAPADIASQTPEGSAAGEATPLSFDAPVDSGPVLPANPSILLERVKFLPVISGALFDTTHVYMVVSTRVKNLGDEPFQVFLSDFGLETADGTPIKELGQQFAPSEFKRLGVTDRFNDLTMRSGGGVSEELIFYLEATPQDLILSYSPSGFEPLTVDLGTISADQQLAALLGTPTAESTEVVVAAAVPEDEPTATNQPTPAGGAARTIPESSLVGTIAYADFDGATYNLFFGNVATGDSVFWRGESSQPMFSRDGSRIAYHSWANNSRGLITSNPDHSDGFLVGTFLEDQLPTFSPDSNEVLFLSRRTGSRQSQLYKASANQEKPEAQFILEGEYPTWHPNGTVVFKGWETSGIGLRVATGDTMTEHESLTDFDGDTAPSISPDGKRVAFMSNRNDNWDIYVVNIDGSGLTRLTTDDARDGLPTWSPDGKAIAFVSNRGGPWAVWAMTLRGSGIRQLFTYQGSPDGFVASEPNTDTTRGWAEERLSWTKATY